MAILKNIKLLSLVGAATSRPEVTGPERFGFTMHTFDTFRAANSRPYGLSAVDLHKKYPEA